MSMYKKFNQKLFNENDVDARLAVLNHLDSQGLFAKENDDKYGPDLVLYRGLKPIAFIEVEVKRVWTGATFPWSTIQLPERKLKFAKLGLPVEFWILNDAMEHAVIIADTQLDLSLLKEVPNKYISKGEMFFQIPIESCNMKELNYG